MTSFLLGPDNLSGTVATDADNGSLEATGIPRPLVAWRWPAPSGRNTKRDSVTKMTPSGA